MTTQLYTPLEVFRCLQLMGYMPEIPSPAHITDAVTRVHDALECYGARVREETPFQISAGLEELRDRRLTGSVALKRGSFLPFVYLDEAAYGLGEAARPGEVKASDDDGIYDAAEQKRRDFAEAYGLKGDKLKRALLDAAVHDEVELELHTTEEEMGDPLPNSGMDEVLEAGDALDGAVSRSWEQHIPVPPHDHDLRDQWRETTAKYRAPLPEVSGDAYTSEGDSEGREWPTVTHVIPPTHLNEPLPKLQEEKAPPITFTSKRGQSRSPKEADDELRSE